MSSLASLQPCTSSLHARPQAETHRPDDVYTRLLDAIVEQRILPGSRLSEDALAQRYGASRSHVREALSRLSYQQVVTVQSNARARVAAPTDEQIRQALHARRLTEMALIPMACKQPKKEDLRQLHQLLESQRQSQAENRHGAAIRLAGAFHQYLAKMAGNAPLGYFLGNLVPLTSLAIARNSTTSTGTWQHQAAIAKAVEDQDETTAVRLMSLYLDDMVLRCTPAPPVKASTAQPPRESWLQASHR